MTTTATVLVVDDSKVDRRLAQIYVEKAGMHVLHAANGREALQIIGQRNPDIVLTDLQMPELDGLELTREISTRHPTIPVVLMTAHGSEEIAVTALKTGAASYVSKKNLPRDLAPTLQLVRGVARVRRVQQRLLSSLCQCDYRFELPNDSSSISGLIEHLQDNLRQMRLCEEGELVRVGTALHEAVLNAIEHGNLELDSKLRESGDGAYEKLAIERMSQPPYQDRRVHISASFNRDRVRYAIRDEGPGFDPSALPDPTEPENIEKVSGRGLLLIRLFMDEVTFDKTGNELTMVKYKNAVN